MLWGVFTCLDITPQGRDFIVPGCINLKEKGLIASSPKMSPLLEVFLIKSEHFTTRKIPFPLPHEASPIKGKGPIVSPGIVPQG